MHSPSAPWHRAGPALFALVLVLATLLVPNAATGGVNRRTADTWFQTIRFLDGSSARLTVSTRSTQPASGEGVDLGTVYATGPTAAAGARLAPADAASAPADRLGTNAGGGTGTATAWGWVNYTSAIGIELWRWVHQISWSYSAFRVTAVHSQIAASLRSCCLWDYQGLLTKTHGPPGGPNFTAYAQGKYRQCLTSIICQSKAPWIWLQGNGNGVLTGFSWGIG